MTSEPEDDTATESPRTRERRKSLRFAVAALPEAQVRSYLDAVLGGADPDIIVSNILSGIEIPYLDRYMKGDDRCPFCAGEVVTTSTFFAQGGPRAEAYRPFCCKQCKQRWCDVYSLTAIEVDGTRYPSYPRDTEPAAASVTPAAVPFGAGTQTIWNMTRTALHTCTAPSLRAALEEAVRAGVLLISADLGGKDLTMAQLSAAKLGDACLTRTDLSLASLVGADLTRADCCGGSLAGADLRKARLVACDFAGADLSGADFTRADLSGANFSGANLSGANLSDTDLTDTDFSGANLSGVNFSGAGLRETLLDGADLTAATINWDSGEMVVALAEYSGLSRSEWRELLVAVQDRGADWRTLYPHGDPRRDRLFAALAPWNPPTETKERASDASG